MSWISYWSSLPVFRADGKAGRREKMEQEKNKMEQGKSKQQRMRELVELLNRARKAYEQDNTEIMSNYEYDRLYDELEELEKELGTKMANSPTVNVGYEVVSGLPKAMSGRCCHWIRQRK